jgi:geranylgeranyl pyrophosphate synthase
VIESAAIPVAKLSVATTKLFRKSPRLAEGTREEALKNLEIFSDDSESKQDLIAILDYSLARIF